MKKIIAAAIGATLLAGQSLSAAAAPAETTRTESPVGKSEGAISSALLVAIFAAIGVGIIVAVEESENDSPTSP